MAKFDITEIEESTITVDLEGKLIGIYGTNNTGKTYVASRLFPGETLWLATERGINAQSGIRLYPIDNWNDFRDAVTQLTTANKTKREKVRNMYKCVVVDVADKLPSLCSAYIVSKYNTKMSAIAQKKGNLYTPISEIGEIPYGAGWKMWRTEHDTWVDKLFNSGFCVCLIFHPETKTFNADTESEYKQIVPKSTLDYTGPILKDNLDFVIYLENQGCDEFEKPILSKGYCVQHKEFFARSRFTHCPEVINPFTVENLRETIKIACEREVESQGTTGVSNKEYLRKQEEEKDKKKLTHTELIEMIGPIFKALIENNCSGYVTSLVTEYLGSNEDGSPKKISSCTEKDVSVLQLIYDELMNYANQQEIEWE